MDISAVVINKLLTEKNLDVWSKLKLAFLDPAYSSVYSLITRYAFQQQNNTTTTSLNAKVNVSDTSNMLYPYAKNTNITSALLNKLNLADTAMMLRRSLLNLLLLLLLQVWIRSRKAASAAKNY